MRTDDDSRGLDSRWAQVDSDRRAVEEHLRAVMRDMQTATPGTPEATRLRAEARSLLEEHGRLADESGRIGRGLATLPAVADIERERDRRRISLQIRAVVGPWRDARPEMNEEECEQFRARGHALLNYLDVAVMPYPDLQAALAAARSELGSASPRSVSRRLH